MKTKKILYISFENSQKYTGGALGNKSRIASLEEIVGANNVDTLIVKPHPTGINILSGLKKIYYILKGYMVGVDHNFICKVITTIKDNDYDYVFIDSSLLGCLCKIIKKATDKVKTIVFFQNIEYDFFVSNTVNNKDYIHFFYIFNAKANEKKACKYADKVIVLNKKDSLRINELYYRPADLIVPVTLPDNYKPTNYTKNKETDLDNLKLLFIGSYFFGNTVGLNWFCHEIYPLIKRKTKLTIVGSDMSKFSRNIEGIKNITIYDNVPDLSIFYENADLMIMPIRTGGGMKTKTAEALKFGKFIIGTKEALEGYQIDSSFAITCNTKKEFIDAIESFNNKHKYCQKAYKCFNKKYSYKASADAIKNIL